MFTNIEYTHKDYHDYYDNILLQITFLNACRSSEHNLHKLHTCTYTGTYTGTYPYMYMVISKVTEYVGKCK